MRHSGELSAYILPSCSSLQAMTPKAMGGLNDAAPKEETDILSQDEGEVRSLGEEAASAIPSGKEVAEEEVVAGTPSWEVRQLGTPTGTSPAWVLLRSPRALQGREAVGKEAGVGAPLRPLAQTAISVEQGALCGGERQ